MWRPIHKAFVIVFPILSMAQPGLNRLGNQEIVMKRCFEVMAIWIGFHSRSKFKHNCLPDNNLGNLFVTNPSIPRFDSCIPVGFLSRGSWSYSVRLGGLLSKQKIPTQQLPWRGLQQTSAGFCVEQLAGNPLFSIFLLSFCHYYYYIIITIK